MRYIFLLLLIAASIGIFVALIIPRYHAAQTVHADVVQYNANLATATKLQQSRQALISQYNNIPKADLDNIQTLLPDSVDNIRLIIQLDALATKNGLSSLRSVDYDPAQVAATAAGTVADPAPGAVASLPYGEFTMSFQTSGQYSNFLSFLSDLEQNLRLVDIVQVDFLPPDASTQNAASSFSYKVKLKTYWLKQ